MNKTEKTLFGIILFVIDLVITGYAIRYIWNSVVSVFFGVRTITFWQGYLLTFVFSYFLPEFCDKDKDTIKQFLTDIIYTLFVWLIVFLLVTFVGV